LNNKQKLPSNTHSFFFEALTRSDRDNFSSSYFKISFSTGGEENGSPDMEAADSLHQHLPHPLIQHHSGVHYISFKGTVS
jgi:hypothetical protein